ncbi:helix-turn-helix transcriptional regulator [Candidatus Kaiserbacteria bacterium]|nr:helix-turn-helix transcriptional regulator [Candidatus Kaiserbacteria bacterium]
MKKQKITEKDLKWHTFDEVLAHLSKSKAFREAYAEERARRRLARQIRDLREAQRLTQLAVARRADMPQSVIARVESGDRGISVDTLGKIAHTLGKEVQLV